MGVAQPTDMATITIAKIKTSGVTLISNGPQRAQPVVGSGSDCGASSGWRQALKMIQPRNIAAIITPGTRPAINSPLMEIPARLPSRTVSADGGMSMSTPPMAMMGPMASRGW